MGNKPSSVENNCIQELSKINEEELDISRIDKGNKRNGRKD